MVTAGGAPVNLRPPPPARRAPTRIIEPVKPTSRPASPGTGPRAAAWLPVLAWMALIFWLSAQPDLRALDVLHAAALRLAAAGWTAPAAWLERLGLAAPTLAAQPGTPAHLAEVALRKTAHVVAYAVLAVLARRAAGRTPPLAAHPGRWGAAIALLYGAADELHQGFVPGRDGRASDVAVDGVGALLGLTLARRRARGTDRRVTGPRGG